MITMKLLNVFRRLEILRHFSLIISLVLVSNSPLGLSADAGNGDAISAERFSAYFAHLIVKRFGGADDKSLNATELDLFLRALPTNAAPTASSPASSSQSDAMSSLPSLRDCLALEPGAIWSNCSSIPSCLKTEEMMNLARGSTNRVDAVDADVMKLLAPSILYQMATGACYVPPANVHIPNHARKVPLAKSFGYGVLFVAIISLCSLGGAVVLPFMDKKFYKRILTWMVGLAVGTLAGSGLLHLMPHTYGMTYEEFGNWNFLFKASAIFAGSYLFFCIERLLKTLSEWRLTNKNKNEEKKLPVVNGVAVIANNNVKTPISTAPPFDSTQTLSLTPVDQMTSSSMSSASSKAKSEEAHGHSHHGLEPEGGIAPVAWMIIFGDGLHNFIDGLSIGAAFTESILAGISIAVAVFCEELPHELGDLAILLNSGMKFKQALFYNFLSACLCFVGLCLGILLGDVTEFGAKWIFALAAGMFLYLALTDMIPELNRQADELVGEGTPLWKILLIQHSGVLLGFSIMLIMAIYGSNIDFTGNSNY